MFCDFCRERKDKSELATDWTRYKDAGLVTQVTLHICEDCEREQPTSEQSTRVAKYKDAMTR